MTGASRSTLTAALGRVIGIGPFLLNIKEEAIKALLMINSSSKKEVLETFNFPCTKEHWADGKSTHFLVDKNTG